MNPAALIPAADAIPVPWGWFYGLLMLTFLLHVLFMNAMLGGGIIAFISALRPSEDNHILTREFSYKWPYTIAFAVNMGVAPLLFVQVLYGHFIYTSSILMAVWWFSIFVLLIFAYYGAYLYDFKFDPLAGRRTLVLGVSVLILLVIAFFFVNNMTLMLQPDQWPMYFENAQGTHLNLQDPALFPRYLHFVIGAVAVAGLLMTLTAHLGFTRNVRDPKALIETGLRYFTGATGIQILLGIWFLLALPRDVMMTFMGGSVFGTALLIIGLVLAGLALYFGRRRQLMKTAVTTLILMVVMLVMRDLVRIAYLKPFFSLSDLPARPEYSPLIFFLVVFAAGLVLIGYMIKLAMDCRKEVS